MKNVRHTKSTKLSFMSAIIPHTIRKFLLFFIAQIVAFWRWNTVASSFAMKNEMKRALSEQKRKERQNDDERDGSGGGDENGGGGSSDHSLTAMAVSNVKTHTHTHK